jgi:hypothetical protein
MQLMPRQATFAFAMASGTPERPGPTPTWSSCWTASRMSGCTLRSQELCLTAYLDPDTASRALYLVAALSRTCHYHPYELAPASAELTGWLDQAAQVLTQIQAGSTAPASQT